MPDGFDTRDTCERHPVRAFIYGSLAGLVLTIIYIGGGLALAALQEGGVHDAGDLLTLVLFVLMAIAMILMIGFPIAAVCALACLRLLTLAESRFAMARQLPVWMLAGTICALPAAWLLTPRSYDYAPNFFLWIVACGTIGGLVAWPTYYGKLPQIRSRNSSSTAR